MDEMIQIFPESKKPGPAYTPPGIRRVFYTDRDSIRRVLEQSSSSMLNPEATPFIPRTVVSAKPEDAEVQGDQLEVIEASESLENIEGDEPEGSAVDLEAERAALVESIYTTQVFDSSIPPSEERIKAASVLQARYRKAMAYKRGITRSSLSLARGRIFAACLAQAQDMEWPHRYYRLIYLCPLTHILVCIDTVHTFILSGKDKAKKQWKQAGHAELEELGQRITQLK